MSKPKFTARPCLGSPARQFPRAFTLIELLVCISVIALLIALVVPPLRRSIAQSRAVASLSTMRQMHAGLGLYAGDFRDHVPFLGTPHRPWEPLQIHGHTLAYVPYFRQSELVMSVVSPQYLDAGAVFVSRVPVNLEGVIHSMYNVTHTAFAAPAYWRGDDPPDDLSLYTGMRMSDAVYPSLKGLTVDHERSLDIDLTAGGRVRGPWLIGRVDGAAGLEAYNPDDEQPILRSYGAAPTPPMMTTIDGFAGRDF